MAKTIYRVEISGQTKQGLNPEEVVELVPEWLKSCCGASRWFDFPEKDSANLEVEWSFPPVMRKNHSDHFSKIRFVVIVNEGGSGENTIVDAICAGMDQQFGGQVSILFVVEIHELASRSEVAHT